MTLTCLRFGGDDVRLTREVVLGDALEREHVGDLANVSVRLALLQFLIGFCQILNRVPRYNPSTGKYPTHYKH